MPKRTYQDWLKESEAANAERQKRSVLLVKKRPVAVERPEAPLVSIVAASSANARQSRNQRIDVVAASIAPFAVAREGTSEVLEPSAALGALTVAIEDTIQSSNSCVLVMWPGALGYPPLAHAITCLDRWSRGDKRGVRTLLSPMQGQHRIRVGRMERLLYSEGLLAWIRDHVTSDPKITRECREKDSLLFGLDRIEGALALSPVLGELIPSFVWMDRSNDSG